MASAADNASTPTTSRSARRRERTRARLLEAARDLFARQGVDATRINEITEEADVGFGSFYNHFASKDDIVAAVLEQVFAAHGDAVDAMTGDLDDPAEVVAVAHRYFVDVAREDPSTAWLVVRLEASHEVLNAALGERAARDIARGVATGRFTVPDTRLALRASGGALVGVMRGVLQTELGNDAGTLHAEGVLRLLGVGAADAAAIARRPLPPRP